MTTLILGIGNEWASDDGVGPEVVRRLQGRWKQGGRESAEKVEFSILAQPDLSLLDRIAGCAYLIVVDAVVAGQPPGTLHREMWEPGVLAARGVQRASSHGFGVRELLEMAAVMGKLPERVELWGIEIASTEPGQGLSPEVAGAVDGVGGGVGGVVGNKKRRWMRSNVAIWDSSSPTTINLIQAMPSSRYSYRCSQHRSHNGHRVKSASRRWRS